MLGWVLLLTLLLTQVWALYLLVPGEGEPFFPGQDKVGHVLLFGAPFAVALLLRARVVAVLIVAHALASEPLQGLLTATRMVDVWDLVADLVGIALALILTRALLRARSRRAPGMLDR